MQYYKYSRFLKNKYGCKTYKLPVNLPVSCPNRDGTIGKGGCSFCGEKGAGFESFPSDFSVKRQLLEHREYIRERYGAEKFIAYFQNFTNTYLPLEKLLSYIDEALEVEDIVEISLSTRPDCINSEYLQAIREKKELKNPEVNLSLELGLQTVNYHTLVDINRGHTLAELIEAVLLAQKDEFETGIHLILNLPGDDRLDVIESAKILSALKVDNVKLHALYIREGTQMADLYKEDKLDLISLEEYIERVILFLEHLNPGIAVQRLLGRAPDEGSLFVNWGEEWWQIHNWIIEAMEKREIKQGDKYNYPGEKTLLVFHRNK